MSASLIDRALRRARRRASLPKGATRQAHALWQHMTTGDQDCGAPCWMLRPRVPSLSVLADGCVALAVQQAARGIRTVKGRPPVDRAPQTVR